MPARKGPENETPEARFIRIANIRAANVITGIDNLGKLVGPSYKSTEAQHHKLFAAIEGAMNRAKVALKANKPAARTGDIL